MFHVKQEDEMEPQEYNIGTSDKNEIYIKQEEIKEENEYFETSDELKIYNKQDDIKEEKVEIDPLQDIELYDEFAIKRKQEYQGDLEVKQENQSEIYIQNGDLNEETKYSDKCLNSGNENKTDYKDKRLKLTHFKCDQCEYSSKEEGILNRHKLTHSNIRSFNCNQCEFSFGVKSHLKTHKLIDSNQQPFKCDQLEFSCRQKGMDAAVRKYRQRKKINQDPELRRQMLEKERERDRMRREKMKEERLQNDQARKLWREKERLRKQKNRDKKKTLSAAKIQPL